MEPRRAHGWSAATVTLLAAIVAAAFTGGGVATASDDDKPHVGDFGAFGSLFIFGIAISADGRSTDGGSVTSSGTAEARPVPAPTFTSPQDSADVTLHLYAFSEENYYAVNGAYTADAAQLDLIGVPASPAVRIVRADRTTFCLEAVTDDGSGFTFDQADGFVQPGLNC